MSLKEYASELVDEREFETATEYLRRSGGVEGGEAIVYLPGLQGDWSGMWKLGELLREKYWLVELCYPRRPEWGLPDYVERLRRAMEAEGLGSAHILAESFGATIAWAFAFAYPEKVRSVIFAGGFAQPVKPWGIPVPQGFIDGAPLWLRERIVWMAIGLLSRSKYAPADLKHAAPLMAGHRGDGGWRSVRARMAIVRECDWRPWLGEVTWPVAYLGGSWDEVVPTKREARTIRDGLPEGVPRMVRLLKRTAHPVLFIAPEKSAQFVDEWMEVLGEINHHEGHEEE